MCTRVCDPPSLYLRVWSSSSKEPEFVFPRIGVGWRSRGAASQRLEGVVAARERPPVHRVRQRLATNVHPNARQRARSDRHQRQQQQRRRRRERGGQRQSSSVWPSFQRGRAHVAVESVSTPCSVVVARSGEPTASPAAKARATLEQCQRDQQRSPESALPALQTRSNRQGGHAPQALLHGDRGREGACRCCCCGERVSEWLLPPPAFCFLRCAVAVCCAVVVACSWPTVTEQLRLSCAAAGVLGGGRTWSRQLSGGRQGEPTRDTQALEHKRGTRPKRHQQRRSDIEGIEGSKPR